MVEPVRLENLGLFAKGILKKLEGKPEGATVFALQGDLGAGKTTFVQALAGELGITETVQSPTYVLMKKYDISYRSFTTLIHIDAYRLANAGEFAALKPERFLGDPKVLVAFEWPERVEGALPKPDLTLKFSLNPDALVGAGGVQNRERYIETIYAQSN